MRMGFSELTPEQAEELSKLAENLDETLRAAGAESAELALGVIVRLGFLPALGLVLLLFLFKVVNIILAFVVLIIISLVLLGISMLISERARWNTMQRVYRSRVETEIAQFMVKHGVSRQQFDSLVSLLLPARAPLANFLSSAAEDLAVTAKEKNKREKE